MEIDDLKKRLNNDSELYLRVKVMPGAEKNEFREKMADNTFKISVSAQPERGRANRELVKFLSKFFDIKKENIKILSGVGDRFKLIKIFKS